MRQTYRRPSASPSSLELAHPCRFPFNMTAALSTTIGATCQRGGPEAQQPRGWPSVRQGGRQRLRVLPSPVALPATARPVPVVMAASSSSTEYNREMKQAMGWEHVSPFEYHFDRGLYFHEVEPNVYCGSQPRNVPDVEYLAKEMDITTILNLQQDRDLEYWGVDIHSLQRRCDDLGVNLVRRPARDFDGDSLRHTLPRACRALHEALQEDNAKVYVHCTAGLGRSPGVCIAHMFWFGDFGDLDNTYKTLTDIRPCGPKREAIRGATFDLLTDSSDPVGAFQRTDHMAYTSLTPQQKHVLRYNVLRAT